MMKKLLLILLVVLLVGGGVTVAVVTISHNNDDPVTTTAPNTTTTPGTTMPPVTVTFKDENGTLLDAKTVDAGAPVSFSYDPTDTVEWDYTFEGWATSPDGTPLSALPPATEAVTYYAIVSAEKQQYTVTFNENGGSDVPDVTVPYGDTVSEPTRPTREGNYRFVGWTDAAGEPVTFPLTVTGHITLTAAWNETVDVSAYLSALLEGYELNPYAYIPESLQPGYAVITDEQIVSDYASDFVSVSALRYGGFGEQWNMVIDNLEQTKTFFTVLSGIDSVASASIVAFNNYLDSNPDDAAHYETRLGDYDVTISFHDNTLFYVLSFETAGLHPEIMMTYEPATQNKTVRIQLSDANALKYEITQDSYTLALRYLGVRRTWFDIRREDDGSVKGEIYEYLGVDGSFSTCSAAQFYLSDTYATVVGNKASGIPGFTGYISEVYRVNDGRMLGYEVRETLSSIVYNTLWFNLDDISGINSYKEVTTEEDGTIRYINGSADAFVAKKVGGFGVKMLSRRFDIELRKQYYYRSNGDGTFTKVETTVPMLFVQEENYSTFVKDMKDSNGVTVSVGVAEADLAFIQSEYATKVDVFIEAKDTVTTEYILDYIGTAYNT